MSEEMARDALHDTDKYQVVGGIISPVSSQYEKVGLVLAEHRLAMCRLAVEDSDWIVVDDWEARHSAYQRTAQVLEETQKRLDGAFPNVQVVFLAGADLIKSFGIPGLWAAEDRMRILERHGCVVVDRWASDISEFLLTDPILYRYRKHIHVVKQFISNDISSTKIRLYIARGLSVKYLLPDSVIAYISQHRLYHINTDSLLE